MIKRINNWFSLIIDIGIKSDYDSVKRNRIQIANALFVFVLPLVIINTINNIMEGDPIGLILGFVWLAFLCIPLAFNYFGKHRWSYGFLVILAVIVADTGYMMFGIGIVLAPIYIMAILSSIFFFDRFYTRMLVIFFILLNYLFFQEFYFDYFKPLFPNIIIGYGKHLYFFFAVFGVSATSMKILRANKNQIKKTKNLNKKLEQKNQEFERFAYITSHDLKEPIRNISRFSGLIKRKSKDNKEIIEYLDFINQNARYLDEMVDAIQDFVKISEGNLNYEAAQLSEIVDIAKKKLSDKIAKKNAEVRVTHSQEVKGVIEQLVILLQNLIDNAIKYNGNEIPIVEISVRQDANQYEIQVKDNGIGISEEFSKGIFMPFKKLHHKSKYEGAGVGLSICKKIVQLHGGKMWVDSNLGDGSTFYCSILKH